MKLEFAVSIFSLLYLTAVNFASEQIHLSLGEDATEMVVTWVTQEQPAGRSTLLLAKQGAELQEITGYWTKFKSGFGHYIYIHRVLLQDLGPGTRYVYSVKDNDSWSKKYTFRTYNFDETGRQPNIVIFGDMGVHNARIVPRLRRQAEKGHGIDAVFHIGEKLNE